MKVEEKWPGRIDQEIVELWFNLPEDQRDPFINAVKQFESDLANAESPEAVGSKWSLDQEIWVHDVPPIRFFYSASQDRGTGQWAATIESFYWFRKP